ncbi:hypothetical protein Afil01_52680 [Actinorhabdospora filicis]|uniref:Nudix hydrolase domain-containing protein n=1 Tax=Actinorhabdospora filicis TaxID=1785913 RepID=A0A9W6SQL1_9ACTN|nr:NUDIX domain-containing protein [Actinorhabdospora filicis]GLZ80461.1 hypothetical protein Afil01_52680 [Actinorhabdospora filicis]
MPDTTPSDPESLVLRDKRDGIEQQVVGGVIARDGRVLLIRRAASDYMGGQWELPSGKVDPGEGLYVALAREVFEETGLTVSAVGEYLGSFDYVSRGGILMRQHNWNLTVDAGDIRLDPEEHDAAVWSPHGELPTPVSADVAALLGKVRP